MKHIFTSLRLLGFFTLLLGLAYPLLMTGIARAFFAEGARGSLVERDGAIVGSRLVGQAFMSPRYFWSRPSAVAYNSLPSGGSNLSPASAELRKQVDERRGSLKAAHPGEPGEPPQDLLFASGSGLDPHISPEAARYQVSRVATERKIAKEIVARLVAAHTEDRQLGFLGEPRVNVLELNLALDLLTSAPAATDGE